MIFQENTELKDVEQNS